MNKFLVTLLLTFLFPTFSWSADYAAINKEIIEKFAIPKQEQLFKTSSDFSNQVETFCSKPDKENYRTTQQHFIRLMDAWQQAQLLRLGPAEMYMRHFRIQMWPDRSNAGTKQIAKLLKNKDTQAIQQAKFSHASTAVQGIPALERLLFGKKSKPQLFATADGKANFRCELLKAISINVHGMTRDMLTEWKTSYSETIRTPSENNDYFETHKEATVQFLKEFATQLQFIVDKKIMRPLDGKRFRSTKSESWRSGQSLNNIEANIKAARELYTIGLEPMLNDNLLKQNLQNRFEKILSTAKELNMPLDQAYQQHQSTLDAWIKQIKELKRLITYDLPKALDIPLGFNSMDGD